MKLILLGAPGVGKGTQAQFITEKFGVPQISTGDMLREAIQNGTELGEKVKKVMESGSLVTDEIILDLVKERIGKEDCKSGFLFDGFPRTIVQAEALLSENINIDHVIEISVPEEEIIQRLSGRRVHQQSGRIYHVSYNPPKIEGLDDITGEPLVQRDDDTLATVKERLRVYNEQTAPLVDFYQSLAKNEGSGLEYDMVTGSGATEEVSKKIISALE